LKIIHLVNTQFLADIKRRFLSLITFSHHMDHPSPMQTAAWRKMSPSEKYQMLAATIVKARELKRAGLRHRFPQDSPEQIESKLAHIWLHARP